MFVEQGVLVRESYLKGGRGAKLSQQKTIMSRLCADDASPAVMAPLQVASPFKSFV